MPSCDQPSCSDLCPQNPVLHHAALQVQNICNFITNSCIQAVYLYNDTTQSQELHKASETVVASDAKNNGITVMSRLILMTTIMRPKPADTAVRTTQQHPHWDQQDSSSSSRNCQQQQVVQGDHVAAAAA
jgi:hypothetical protein